LERLPNLSDIRLDDELVHMIMLHIPYVKEEFYKERMSKYIDEVAERSHYLKYEEAVGSTGQSQGIYIQFLVAVINYIASMNAGNVDSLARLAR